MIQFTKPITIPKKLLTTGKQATEQLKQQYLTDQDYQTGEKRFTFDNKIYGHSSVKNALRKAQNGKCCFCEQKPEIGDIEHFRGKGGYKQSENESLTVPGYYWLAYEWDNLFLSCEKCNRSFKKNYFPLANPIKRAQSHLQNINEEQPLLIEPTKEDPEDFIEYKGIQPRAISGNIKGKTTILRTGLKRPYLNEERKFYYNLVKPLYLTSESPNITANERKELKKELDKLTLPSAPYSSMIKCAIRDKFRF